MKVRFILIFLVLLFVSIESYSQKDVPYPVLPGGSTTNNTTDTLWVLSSTKQFKKVITALNTNKQYKKLEKINKQIIDSLELLNYEQSGYIDSLKKEYDICYEESKKLYENSELLGKMNTRQTMYTRIAVIVGTGTTVGAFIVGFILGKK